VTTPPQQDQPNAAGAPDATSIQEQAWVAQALEGDLVAFNAIVERYQQIAYNLSLRMLRDPSMAEDVTQEAFFSAYRNLARYRGGSLKSWILTIVANRSRDILRSPAKKRTSSLEAYTEGGDPAGPWQHPDALPEEQAERAETSRLVRDAINQLPNDQRTVVTLVDLQQMDYEEASRITGASLGTVKSRLFRGRQRLKESLRPVWELSTDPDRPSS
jgi:RNA polymerase sigma factor (sigma-70 family)